MFLPAFQSCRPAKDQGNCVIPALPVCVRGEGFMLWLHKRGVTPLLPFPRYLYVNSRAWPRDCVISDPMQPPPIAEEIDLHVFDLKTMKEVKRALRAHRAYTPNEECFFIFLDVSRDFVARCVALGVGRMTPEVWDSLGCCTVGCCAAGRAGPRAGGCCEQSRKWEACDEEHD